MLRGEKEKKDVTNVDTHTDRQTDTQTEKGVNPTSRYSTGFSITFREYLQRAIFETFDL